MNPEAKRGVVQFLVEDGGALALRILGIGITVILTWREGMAGLALGAFLFLFLGSLRPRLSPAVLQAIAEAEREADRDAP